MLAAGQSYVGTQAERLGMAMPNPGSMFNEDDTGLLYRVDEAGAWIAVAVVGGMVQAQYLTLALHAGLANERLFVDGNGLTGADGGAGGNYTLVLDEGYAPTWTAVHTFQNEVRLDDGVGDSPILKFIGGSDEQATLHFDDTARSLVITLEDNKAEALRIIDDGGADDYLTIGTLNAQREVVFNQDGADIDYRFEAVGEINAFFLRSSDGRIGVGTNAPIATYDVRGTASIGTLQSGAVFAPQDGTIYFGHPRKFLARAAGVNVGGSTDWMTLLAHPGSKGIILGTSGSADATPHDAVNAHVVVTAANGRVGVGTSAPNAAFDVKGANFSSALTRDGGGAGKFANLSYWTNVNPLWFVGLRQSSDDYYIYDQVGGGGVSLTIRQGGNVIIGAQIAVGVAAPSAQAHIDQSSGTGAVPVLLLDQGDVSEQHILCSISGADVDFPAIIQLDVTGTPELWWDESEDAFVFTNGLAIGDVVGGNYAAFGGDGDLKFVGTAGLQFGGCYGNHIAWVQANAVQNTWYNVADADMVSAPLHGITHDGNGQLTVTEPGHYKITWSLCFEDNVANDHIEVGVEINGSGAAQAAAQGHIENKFASEEEHLGSGNYFDLADNATIEVAIRTTDAGTPTITVHAINLAVQMVGGT